MVSQMVLRCHLKLLSLSITRMDRAENQTHRGLILVGSVKRIPPAPMSYLSSPMKVMVTKSCSPAGTLPRTSHEDIGGGALFKQTSGLTTLYSGIVFFLCFGFLLDYSLDDARANLTREVNDTNPIVKGKDISAFLDIDG